PRLSGASPRANAKPLEAEASVIPGETEEDGLLRREYVLVGDTRAVEINRAVDDYPAPDSSSPPTANTTFPPAPNPHAPPLSSSPSSAGSRTGSNALARALSLATKKLLGGGGPSSARASPHYREYTSSSPRRQQILASRGLGLQVGERDPLEDELLAALEELAQKTEVLTHWADEMYEYVKAVPQKPLPDPKNFKQREGEPEKHAARRKRADVEAEYNAMTCVALYMLLMSFSQKGVNKLVNFYEHLQMRDPDGECEVSEGFDDGLYHASLSSRSLAYFEQHFTKCHDRAALVKTWLPAQYMGPPTFLDQLVYDRALMLSRTAARKELLDQATSPDECEKLYEESLWCLYALQDDLLQQDNPYVDEDRSTISTWIKRTKLRLVRCRIRMGMNDRDRVKDAQLDTNLTDIQREPPPWEPGGLDPPDPRAH
ncbi:hypothetical protein CERSUDRAFT_51641, partial [Gelatoporia subvermispora B]